MSEQAPGKLDLVRRFLNTVSFAAGNDPLEGPDRLEEWCAAEGFDCGPDPQDLRRLRSFREGLRAVALANAGHGDLQASWQAIEPFAASASFTIKVEGAGVPSLSPEGAGVDRAIAAILGIVYDAVRAGQWPRFKACRAGDCLWGFYDRSKNGSGAWCSMADCGNRMKARRRRQRVSNTPKVVLEQA